MTGYDEQQFAKKMDAALKRVRTVLDNTRNPQMPADVPHRYDDKYLLAELVTTTAMASALQCLELLGLTAEGVAELREWARTRTVTLRLAAQEDCTYLREETRKVQSPEHVTEIRGSQGDATRTDKVVVTITEHFWKFDFNHELVAYQGNMPDRAVALLTRAGSIEIKTTAKTTPRPRTVVRPPLELDVTWLFAHLDADGRPAFTIDRTAKDCHTPRRNRQIEEALRAFEELDAWALRLVSYFVKDLFSAQPEHGRNLAAIETKDLFIPVVPFLEGGTRAEGEGVVPTFHASAFIDEERRSLAEKCRSLSIEFPKGPTVVTAVEAGLLVTVLHMKEVAEHLSNALDHIEDMLRKQLVAAIGKELTPVDFDAYMRFHHRKLVKEPYRPKPFSYAIRRPDHDPEGVLAIEAQHGSAMPDPIVTTVASTVAGRPMSFPLDASTRVSFAGDRHLHAWISHRFSGQSGLASSIVARARQFSSFVLLVGRIASADVFEPKLGVIVQNKDLVKIPLMLEDVPTPKQFRDAIESLSPEQQRFARAFRGMQLESTLFAVCVVQIKPQLEKLLKLPPDGLTKEIKLTQELLNLFIEYQIPSDLLSYDGPPDASAADKIARVAEYTGRMREMIELSKKRELEEEREREAMRLAEMNESRSAPGGGGMPYGPPPGFGAPPVAAGPPMAMKAVMRSPSPAAPPAFAPPPRAPAAPPPPAPAAPPPPPQPTASAGAAPVVRTERVVARDDDTGAAGRTSEDGGLDYTKIPGELDRRFEALDEDAALHASIIHTGDVWARTAQKGLLTAPVTSRLAANEQKSEKSKAFDLLDALTKSGALTIEDASLHVVIAASHCFDRTLVETVIQDNVNPIEKVERSLMIVGETLFGLPAAELLADDQRERFFGTSPKLRAPFDDPEKGALGDGSS